MKKYTISILKPGGYSRLFYNVKDPISYPYGSERMLKFTDDSGAVIVTNAVFIIEEQK